MEHDEPSACPATITFMGAELHCCNMAGHGSRHVTDYFQVTNGVIIAWANQRETQATARVWWAAEAAKRGSNGK